MPKHDIVVVGASAGGVIALTQFVKFIPADYQGSIFVVLHLSPHSPSNLHLILARETRLKVVQPKDGERIKNGYIFVATPDHHLLFDKDKILVRKGPKENRFRPSIDALFRSAAYVYGNRVIGIVLSGLLDDGTSGLWNIKRLGGTSIVQQPDDARYSSMPDNALQYVKADYTSNATEMGAILKKLTHRKPLPSLINKKESDLLKMEVLIARSESAFEMGIMKMGKLSPLTCPECHGVLTKITEGKAIRYRCHTGHAFTASTLLTELSMNVEEILWQAMRGIEETSMLLEEIGQHFSIEGQPGAGKAFIKKATLATVKANAIHSLIQEHEIISKDAVLKKK